VLFATHYTSTSWSFFYTLLTVTDFSLVGTYNALIKFFIPGDTNSLASLSNTSKNVVINVLLCNPSASFSIQPATLSPSVNIG